MSAEAAPPPTSAEIAERVARVLANVLQRPLADVTPQASLNDDLGVDDLDRIDITMTLEDQFRIELGDNAMMEARTPADVVALVQKALLP